LQKNVSKVYIAKDIKNVDEFYHAYSQSLPNQPSVWLVNTLENWMDRKDRGASMATVILGFVFFWPVGPALLFCMIWSKRMFSKSQSCHCFQRWAYSQHSNGNSSFDAYEANTLHLEKNRRNFRSLCKHFGSTKDKSEFD
jgi:hypothetical protein